MIGKILYTGACFLAFNKVGNTIATKGFKVLTKAGNIAIKQMPNKYAKVFSNTENTIAQILETEGTD